LKSHILQTDYRGKSIKSNIETILFDFDGTIIDIRPKWKDPIQKAYRDVSGSIVGDLFSTDVESVFSTFPTKSNLFFKIKVLWALGRHGGLSILKSIHFIYKTSRYFKESKFINIPLQGVEHTIITLKERGYKIGIITSAGKDEIIEAKNQLQFLRDIPYVSRNEVKKLKPDPESILLGIKLLNSTIETTLIVGDFTTDISAGKAAGIETCGFLGVFPEISQSLMEDVDPSIIISIIPELLEFFN